uniref:Uncharacterized protein n=1 Tax=Oryzias latipes TaxID=8090 RepID=A0A3P9H9Y2_ORYLA
LLMGEFFSKKTEMTHLGLKIKYFIDGVKTPKSTAKHGGGSVIVWGCFDEFRVDDLYRVRGIFKKVLLLEFFFGQRFNQEQETDPNHKTKVNLKTWSFAPSPLFLLTADSSQELKNFTLSIRRCSRQFGGAAVSVFEAT